MPMTTTFHAFCSGGASCMTVATWPRISQGLRFRLYPLMPVRQNTHLSGQPACVEMQIVRRRSSGMYTLSIVAPSSRRRYNLAAMTLEIRVDGPGVLPEYATEGAAGADLRAAESLTLPAGGRAAVATGLFVEIPAGYVGLVWPRSGLAVRHGIDTLAGVIDSDYRGAVRVVLVNHGQEPFQIAPGDRIAQLLIQPVERASFGAASSLAGTERGEGGFGSTG